MPFSNHDPTSTVVAVDVLTEDVVVLLVVVVDVLVVGVVVVVLVMFVVRGIDAIGTNRIAMIVLLLAHTLVHSVLKRLHHPLLLKEMLRQPAVSEHLCLHCSRLAAVPDGLLRYISPCQLSHA